MAGGWISIHRQIQNHWLWGDKPFSKGQAWIDLLLMANHEDSRFLLGNQIIEAKKGDVITSEVKLMKRWGWSKSKVRAFLSLLENDSMIVKKADTKKTTLNLVNYGVWQDSQTAKKLLKDREETAKEPLRDTINNSDTLNNSNNTNIVFESLWKLYPKKEGKGQISKTQKEKLAKIGLEELSRAIERYKLAKAGTDLRYIQKGSTWFNTGFTDYLDANYQEMEGNKNGEPGTSWVNSQSKRKPWELSESDKAFYEQDF
jgi:DNA replication protein DnaD